MTVSIVTSIIVWVITGALGALSTYFGVRYKKMKKENNALKNGVQSLLRNKIIEYHEKYTRKGYCPIYAKEAVRHNYEAYHELGGSGVITKLYEEIMELPVEKKVQSKPKNSKSGGNRV